MSLIQEMKTKYDLPEDANIANYSLAADVDIGEEDEQGYKFVARIASDILDLEGEVVLPSGVNLDMLLKSGFISWNHNWLEGGLPIGVPDTSFKPIRTDNTLIVGGKFLKKPADWQGEWMPDYVRSYCSQAKAAGISVGVSMGFLVLEKRKATVPDTIKYGKRCKAVVSKSKCFEFAIAPHQANTDASIMAIKAGKLDNILLKKLNINIDLSKPVETKSFSMALMPKVKHMTIKLRNNTMNNVEAERGLLKSFGKLYL